MTSTTLVRPWRALARTATTAVGSGLLWLALSVPLAPLVLAVVLVHRRPDDANLLAAAALGLLSLALLAVLGPRLALGVAAIERRRLRLAPARARGGLYTDPATWRAVAYVLLLAVVTPLWTGVLAGAGVVVVSTPLAVYYRIAGADAIGEVAGRIALGLVLIPVLLSLASAFASGHAVVARMPLSAESDRRRSHRAHRGAHRRLRPGAGHPGGQRVDHRPDQSGTSDRGVPQRVRRLLAVRRPGLHARAAERGRLLVPLPHSQGRARRRVAGRPHRAGRR
jgi:hypothetical protein